MWLSIAGSRALRALLAASMCAILSVQVASSQRGAGSTQQHEGPRSTASLGNYYALIIGIDGYREWPPLRFAETDARDIRDILVSDYGFDPQSVAVLRGKTATRVSVLSRLSDRCVRDPQRPDGTSSRSRFRQSGKSRAARRPTHFDCFIAEIEPRHVSRRRIPEVYSSTSSITDDVSRCGWPGAHSPDGSNRRLHALPRRIDGESL